MRLSAAAVWLALPALLACPAGGAADAGASDIGASDIGASDIGAPDIGASDIGASDIGASDIGASDIGASDIGASDIGASDIGASDIGTPDAGADPSWPLQPDIPPLTAGNWYRPDVSATWQWQLSGAINSSYDVEIYDIDLFDTDTAAIASLQGQGRRVICYFSAGSSEDWRPDFVDFEAADMGDDLGGWPGERWLDIRRENVYRIMLGRLDLAQQKGCDGIEPDNVDAYANSSGFALTATDQLAYNRALANAAHRRGLAVALKNDLDQVLDLIDYYDLALNEECHDYNECSALAPFVAAGKPVLNAEYADSLSQAQNRAASLCGQAQSAGLRTLILPWDLDDSFRVSCDDG